MEETIETILDDKGLQVNVTRDERNNIILNVIDSKKYFENATADQILVQMTDSMDELITVKEGLSSTSLIDFFRNQNKVVNSSNEKSHESLKLIEEAIKNDVKIKKPDDDGADRSFQLFSLEELLIMNKTKKSYMEAYIEWWDDSFGITEV